VVVNVENGDWWKEKADEICCTLKKHTVLIGVDRYFYTVVYGWWRRIWMAS
jgi:hypothetical protein